MKRTIRFEIKKILQSKLLWVMVVIAVAINAAIVLTNSYERPGALYLAQVAEQTGTKITAASVRKLEEIYSGEAKKFENAGDPFHMTNEQQAASRHVAALQSWLDSGKAFLEEKPRIAAKEMLEERLIGVKDPLMRSLLTKQFQNFEPRLDQMNQDGEMEWLGINMEYFGTHSFLFEKLLPVVYLEMVFIGAFVLLNALNFEFSTGTDQIVYASRRGRKLHRDKYLASFLVTTGLFLFFCGGFVTGFFLYFRQGVFLDVPVSAQLYGGYITKIPFTLLGYLLANLAVGYLLICLFQLLAYSCGSLKGQFAGLGSFFGLLLCLFGAGAKSFAGFSTIPQAVLAFNPVSMLISADPEGMGLHMNPDTWFCFINNAASFANYILYTLAFWFLFAAILAVFSKQMFRKRSL